MGLVRLVWLVSGPQGRALRVYLEVGTLTGGVPRLCCR